MVGIRWALIFLLLASTVQVLAQSSDEANAAREKQRRKKVLIESIMDESRQLRLPENRAIALSRLANRIWDLDQERADNLFREAVNELLAAQAAAESTRRPGDQNDLLTSQTTRPQVLQSIAARNAEFALQSLYKTRPASILRAIFNLNSKDAKLRTSPSNDGYYAQNELQLEQSLIKLAADQSPEKAVALLRQALRNGITGETLGLLKKLFEKDQTLGNQMAGDVIAQLLKKPFVLARQPDYQSLQVSISLLTESIRERSPGEKAIRFDDGQLRSLADKAIASFLEGGSQYGYGYGPSLIQIAEKLSPSSVEKLKQLDKITPRRVLYGCCGDPEASAILREEMTAEQMLDAAGRLPLESRGQVYLAVANKFVGEGNMARARSVLRNNFDGDALENAETNLNWTYAQHILGTGRFEEAEALIDQFPEANKISALISLANSAYSVDPEKYRSYAMAVLEKARAQVPPKPENNTDMSNLMQIAGALSRIAPSEAFRIIESIIPQVNEITEASVVVTGFQGGYARKGELLITQTHAFGVYVDLSIFRGLADADFERTMNILGSFSRREMRVNTKQTLLEYL